MQDADLFLELAAIGGVFVGFGTLIAVRGGGASATAAVAQVRAVVSMGVMAVLAALGPVTLARYDLDGHQVWALSSALVLAAFFVTMAVMARTPEYRSSWTAELEVSRPRWLVIVEGTAYAVYMIALVVTPVVIVLGVAPDLDAALYFTAVVLYLLGAAWTLLTLVFAQRSPAAA